MTTAERRHDNRKKLPADFAVVLRPQDLSDGGPSLHGRAADLTMGGIGIVIPDALDTALESEVWTVSFAVTDKTGRVTDLSLNALITHGRPHSNGHFYGLKFHELHAPAKSAERAALRQFLLSDLRDRWQGNLLLQAPSM